VFERHLLAPKGKELYEEEKNKTHVNTAPLISLLYSSPFCIRGAFISTAVQILQNKRQDKIIPKEILVPEVAQNTNNSKK